MRINPVVAQSHYSAARKINFGMIDNKKTEELTQKMMEEEYDGYFDEDEIGGEEYNNVMKYFADSMHYFKNSSLFTMKSTTSSNDKDVLYITMNQDEINKHEHKELFNKMINKYKDIYDPTKNENEYWIKDAQDAGVLYEEDFFDILEYYGDIKEFYYKMQDKEQGIVPKEPEPRPTVETSDDDYDPDSDEARFEKLRDFVIYGSL